MKKCLVSKISEAVDHNRAVKELFALGNDYAAQSYWVDFAFVKVCLFSLGLIAGTAVADKHKINVRLVTAPIAAATYAFLMFRLLVVFLKRRRAA